MTSKKENIKLELVNYQPTAEEKLVIRSAMFNLVTLATIGAASLGMSARLWAKSRASPLKPRTAIPTILGTFTGFALGGSLGMDKGMHKLRESLPKDSRLLAFIHEYDVLKKQQQEKTLFSGPVIKEESANGTVDLFAADESTSSSIDSPIDSQLDAGEQ